MRPRARLPLTTVRVRRQFTRVTHGGQTSTIHLPHLVPTSNINHVPLGLTFLLIPIPILRILSMAAHRIYLFRKGHRPRWSKPDFRSSNLVLQHTRCPQDRHFQPPDRLLLHPYLAVDVPGVSGMTTATLRTPQHTSRDLLRLFLGDLVSREGAGSKESMPLFWKSCRRMGTTMSPLTSSLEAQ